jgi:hypothetical protein
MAPLLRRDLDPVQVAILTGLLQHHDPVSITFIYNRYRPPYVSTRRIRDVLGYLTCLGYVRLGRLHKKKGRTFYYCIHDEVRDEVRAQIALRGHVDIYPDSVWVLAAFCLVQEEIGGQCQLISPGMVYTKLLGLGKPLDGSAVLQILEQLATQGQVDDARRGSFRYFHMSQGQQLTAECKLAHFPLMPYYQGDASAQADAQADAEEVFQFGVTLARPIKVRECAARFGVHVLAALRQLVLIGKMGRLAFQDKFERWDDEDVVYVIPGAVDRPMEPHHKLSIGFGQSIDIYSLTADEVAILPNVMRRKIRFSPFAISKQVFKDTDGQRPLGGHAAIPLRALPALRSLVGKGFIVGENRDCGRRVPCRHDGNSSYLFCEDARESAKFSLEHTTGKFHCRRCGDERSSNGNILVSMYCDDCIKVFDSQVIPAPGVRPIRPEDTPILHAVAALQGQIVRVRPIHVAAFAFTCEFNCDRAIIAATTRTVPPEAITDARLALYRLADDGYLTFIRGQAWLDFDELYWVESNYQTWPHVEALAAENKMAGAATKATPRTGRAIEID